MGRAGLEPATGGLKVDASFSRGLAAAVRTACLSQVHLACVRVLWECLVDPLLTPGLVLPGNGPPRLRRPGSGRVRVLITPVTRTFTDVAPKTHAMTGEYRK